MKKGPFLLFPFFFSPLLFFFLLLLGSKAPFLFFLPCDVPPVGRDRPPFFSFLFLFFLIAPFFSSPLPPFPYGTFMMRVRPLLPICLFFPPQVILLSLFSLFKEEKEEYLISLVFFFPFLPLL